jgi:anti-sigma factor RsiW
MNCEETRRFLDVSLDGELDLVRHLELEAHLRGCPACAQLEENARARGEALGKKLPRFTASTRLAKKIRAAARSPGFQSESLNAAGSNVPTTPPAPPKVIFPVWQLTGLAASVAFALLAGFAWGGAHVRTNLLFEEAIAEHVRSLQVTHLTDVASTDQHTVKPWFAGKLDFSPPVFDLAPTGFSLTGGRLEHIDGRPAAALVFHRRQHALNLFIWPANERTLSSRVAQRDGYNAATWSQTGLNFLAVSEISATELTQFAEAFRHANQ